MVYTTTIQRHMYTYINVATRYTSLYPTLLFSYNIEDYVDDCKKHVRRDRKRQKVKHYQEKVNHNRRPKRIQQPYKFR